jgi:hypothetical protein
MKNTLLSVWTVFPSHFIHVERNLGSQRTSSMNHPIYRIHVSKMLHPFIHMYKIIKASNFKGKPIQGIPGGTLYRFSNLLPEAGQLLLPCVLVLPIVHNPGRRLRLATAASLE